MYCLTASAYPVLGFRSRPGLPRPGLSQEVSEEAAANARTQMIASIVALEEKRTEHEYLQHELTMLTEEGGIVRREQREEVCVRFTQEDTTFAFQQQRIESLRVPDLLDLGDEAETRAFNMLWNQTLKKQLNNFGTDLQAKNERLRNEIEVFCEFRARE